MGVGVIDEDLVLKTGVKMELEGRKMGGVAELGFLEARDRLFGEQVLNEEMAVLLDSVSVHCENTGVAPGCWCRGDFSNGLPAGPLVSQRRHRQHEAAIRTSLLGRIRQVFEEPQEYLASVLAIAPPSIASCSEHPTRTAGGGGGCLGGKAAYDVQGSTQLVGQ